MTRFIHLLCGFALPLSLAAKPAEVDFSRDIRPILNANCTGCHGGVMKQGDVSFLYREQVLAKGKSGKATVIPFNPDGSEMMYRITTDNPDDIMPQPKHGPPLKEKEIALIRQWIEEGAKWNNHWSFEKPERQAAPEIETKQWPKSDIDRFLLARMEKEGLSPARPAKPGRLLRRLHLDLTGIPPSIEELDQFESAYTADPDQAVSETINRLLSQDSYGEKWASQWLDLARYADSEGLGADRRWLTWPYRDWVIRALNQDMPYQDFLTKQLAGDLLPNRSFDDLIATNFHRLTQQNEEGGTDNEEFRTMAVMDRTTTTWEALQGVTFGCVQCHDHPYDPIRHDEYYKFLAFFNSTRDKDLASHHPVIRVPHQQKDYPKALELLKTIKNLETKIFNDGQGLVKSSLWRKVTEMEVKSHRVGSTSRMKDGYLEFLAEGTIPNNTTFNLTIPKPTDLDRLTAFRIHTLPLNLEKARHSGLLGAVLSQIQLKAILPGAKEGLEIPLRYLISDDINSYYDPQNSLKDKKGGGGWGAYTHQYHPRSCVVVLQDPLELPAGAKLQLNLRQKAAAPTGPMAIKRGRVELTDDPAYAAWLDQEAPTFKKLKETKNRANKLGKVKLAIMEELPSHLRRETRTFLRGNWLEKGDTAHQPGTPASLHPLGIENPTRLDLAAWITSNENPFTSRVLVARVWEQIFGIGLVETLEDFGSAGLLPTHGELLDDLAVRFQTEMKGSLKTLIREILMTAAYRQSSQRDSLAREKDPQNIFLSHGPRNRLSAEHIRDHHLAVSGLLNKQLYGAPVQPPIPGGVWKPFAKDPWKTAKVGDPNRYRRSIYTYRKRSIPHPTLDAFDAPTREVCSTRRLTSNTPLGALVTLNDEGFAEFAKNLAQRMKDHPGDLSDQLAFGYRLCTSTKPNPGQLKTLVKLHQETKHEPFVLIAATLLNLDDALTK